MTGLLFCCDADNDLYRALASEPPRYDDPAEAIAAAEPGDAVLVLADGYPDRRTDFPPELVKAATDKDLSVLVEFPQHPANAEPATAVLERVVIEDPRLGPKHSLLAVHACHYLPTSQPDTLLWLAHVAGFDTAVFGLPDSANSLLYKLPDTKILVATTQLSRFVRARYEPYQGWIALWQGILSVLNADVTLSGTAVVTPRYDRDEPLAENAETQAVADYQRWLRQSRMLLTEDQERAVRELMHTGEAADIEHLPAGEGGGSWGVAEGYESTIQADGTQRARMALRADCVAETAMAFALDGTPADHETARNLIEYLRGRSGLCGKERADPNHPAYGLIGWGTGLPAWEIANYGDDNARVILAWLLTRSALGQTDWDEQLITAITANFRTTGRKGHRGDRIDMPQLEANGWQHYFDGDVINQSAHFEAYLWACYQWAYQATGYEPFKEQARNGLSTMMEAFPGGWRRNDVTELARVMLPLAWQLRIDPNDQVRGWLAAVVDALLSHQDSSGGIAEIEAGGIALFKVAETNEEYGTTEEPIIFQTGDSASDQLYTTGFALLGLHEAAAVLNDTKASEGADRLADYLIRIQTKSDRQELNGGWFRSFDFDRWAYWGSSGDAGWGAWCLELGWAPAWCATALSLRERKTTLWQELAKVTPDPKRANDVIARMIPN
ncbi:hypothetical protein [Tenggerimyces flavus]|uniref:Uncharacterized protein n=1 Tax=Tenggerimyces flavus TaxID=1708749 RepID=A0ABV7YB49_9ACTN|nr:hypothetical protein [Tenggerimyces flavus]MBM7788817.1 hypothetical protein [Tenggerimyces flavus]